MTLIKKIEGEEARKWGEQNCEKITDAQKIAFVEIYNLDYGNLLAIFITNKEDVEKKQVA